MYPILVWYIKKKQKKMATDGGGGEGGEVDGRQLASTILVPGSNPHPDTFFLLIFMLLLF